MVMAFYYPWYRTPQVSGSWGHWRTEVEDLGKAAEERGIPMEVLESMGVFQKGEGDFSKLDEDGLPVANVKNHPTIGLYDSSDPLVIRGHLKLAEDSGIDAFIISWWGRGDFSDEVTAKMFDEAVGLNVKLTVYYETVPSRREEEAVADLLYILDRYGERSPFLKVDGKPVIFIYGRAMGEIGEEGWRRVIKKVKEKTDCLLIADSMEPSKVPEGFDGCHFYNPASLVKRGERMAQFFRNYVSLCRERGLIACLTVIPGYDDTVIRVPGIAVPRRGGLLYRALFERAIEADPDWILITSWNEWHEGSEIEPSVEHGKVYLNLTKVYSSRFKGRG